LSQKPVFTSKANIISFPKVDTYTITAQSTRGCCTYFNKQKNVRNASLHKAVTTQHEWLTAKRYKHQAGVCAMHVKTSCYYFHFLFHQPTFPELLKAMPDPTMKLVRLLDQDFFHMWATIPVIYLALQSCWLSGCLTWFYPYVYRTLTRLCVYTII